MVASTGVESKVPSCARGDTQETQAAEGEEKQMSEVWCKNLRETAHVLGRHPRDCFHCEAFALGLAERDARVRELEADVERLRDAVQLEISQRRVDDSYGRDKSACQTVSDILERRGNDFGLMSALAARKETP